MKPIPIIAPKRDTSQFYFRTRREEEIVAEATFPTSDDVMNQIGSIPKGCGLNRIALRCSSSGYIYTPSLSLLQLFYLSSQRVGDYYWDRFQHL